MWWTEQAALFLPITVCVSGSGLLNPQELMQDIRPLTSPIIIQLYTINLMAYNEIKSSPLLNCRQNSLSTAAVKTMERSVCHYCILLKLQNNYIHIINIWCAYSAVDF